jgi:signal transduction histidine kinase
MPRHPPGQQVLSHKREAPTHHHPIELGGTVLASALKATERRLSNLLADRRRIGRDLHDCVLQSLYAIGLNLETSLRVNPYQTAEAKQFNDLTVRQINQLIHEIRGMIRGLESGTVQEFNLASELSTLRATYEQVGHLQVTLNLQSNAIEVLTKEEEREILNIVREALSNCVRHAKATLVTVSIRLRGTRIRVSIGDNGIGFVMTDGRPRGYGLANMDARAKKLGGTLRVQSKQGRGTRIVAEFLLEPILAST